PAATSARRTTNASRGERALGRPALPGLLADDFLPGVPTLTSRRMVTEHQGLRRADRVLCGPIPGSGIGRAQGERKLRVGGVAFFQTHEPSSPSGRAPSRQGVRRLIPSTPFRGPATPWTSFPAHVGRRPRGGGVPLPDRARRSYGARRSEVVGRPGSGAVPRGAAGRARSARGCCRGPGRRGRAGGGGRRKAAPAGLLLLGPHGGRGAALGGDSASVGQPGASPCIRSPARR